MAKRKSYVELAQDVDKAERRLKRAFTNWETKRDRLKRFERNMAKRDNREEVT